MRVRAETRVRLGAFQRAHVCTGMAVVTAMNGILHIELACRCGWTHHFTQTIGDDVYLELDGSALNLEKFSHLRSGSGGTGTLSVGLSSSP